MKAFKINQKTELYDVLKECEKITKRIPAFHTTELKDIMYEAETKTIYASDGRVLFAYVTSEIEDNLGEVKDGVLSIGGSYVILDEKPLSFLPKMKPLLVMSGEGMKRFECNFSDQKLFTAASRAVIECAKNGIKISDKLLSTLNKLHWVFKFMLLIPGDVRPVFFTGDNVSFVVMPLHGDDWKEVTNYGGPEYQCQTV